MDNLVIRKYDDIDFREVISLLKSQFNISDSIEYLNDNANSFGIVATINKSVVGYMRVDKLKNIGKDSYYYILNYICVDSNYQNMNIATKLLEFSFNYANNDNVGYIELTSKSSREAANHLYLKSGFVIRDTNVFRKEI